MMPNIEAVSPIQGVPGVAALAQFSNTDDHRRMNLTEFLDFLYARGELVIDDPKNPGKKITLPAKGPAVCTWSEDWQKNEAAAAALCAKGKCTYEVERTLERMRLFREEVSRIAQ